jgi:hypothetical protein
VGVGAVSSVRGAVSRIGADAQITARQVASRLESALSKERSVVGKRRRLGALTRSLCVASFILQLRLEFKYGGVFLS